ncbi:Protein CBG27275 [Caenorhabditis briggsae]|uniref:Protein CBG27275 n=1 Tax=Caenorhabditis briggsae TaxID=6238 RepID=B6IM47_CAEBR|nr:Protein CBG27275 [Caenorhabditis briggsae]CAS00977.1 Protein CBG27275 [Caenorhabditis briggsae]
MPPSLLQMPDVVLSTIFKKLGPPKSLCGPQKFHRRAQTGIEYRSCQCYSKLGKCQSFNAIQLINVTYAKRNNGCYIIGKYRYNQKEMLVENSNFWELFLEDIKIVLKNQKLPIPHFYFIFKETMENDFLQKLDQSLKTWDHPVPIKRLNMGTDNQKEVVTLVSNIDSKLLESIEMSCARSVKMEMNEIVRLEHWKNLKQVEMSNLVTDLPLHYFSGMARVSICRIFVSGEDVALLKEMFTQYPSMIKFHIHAECVNKPQYERILGKSQVGRSVYGGRLDKWLCEIGDDTVQFALFGSMDNWYFSVKRISKELF